MKRRTVDLHAPRKAQSKGILWLGWALSASSLLALSGVLFSEAASFQDSRKFHGNFGPAVTHQSIFVPANVPLAAVFIRDGDAVIQGQRVALYDTALLKSHIARLEADAINLTLERECLLSTKSPASGPVSRAYDTDGTSLQRLAALRRCTLRHQENALAVERLTLDRNALRTRAVLSHREALERAKLTAPSVRRVLSLRAAIERSELDAAIARLDFKIAYTATQHERGLQVDISRLQVEARDITRKISVLQSYVDSPYLVAPDSGLVARVRNLPLHEGLAEETTLVQIQSDTPRTYEAQLTIPLEQADQLSASSEMWVHFSGLAHSQNAFRGLVSSKAPAPSREDGVKMARVHVTLDLATTETSPGDSSLELLRNGGGHSTVVATFPETNLKSVVGPALGRLGSYF